jgi:uncharacterized membrane protein
VWNRLFLHRLRREMPYWVERGWVRPEHEAAIQDYVSEGGPGTRKAPVAIGILGVLCLGTGVILFFAANWNEMPKIAKLSVLFGGMWAAYAAAGFLNARNGTAARGFAQALLLLGVVLFGANIMLIAQIYHIDEHYPNGVLIWALGALLLCYLIPGQPVAVAGLALALLWAGMEAFEFGHRLFWPFLPVWLLFLPLIYRDSWQFTGGAAMLALLLWGIFTAVAWGSGHEILYLLQIYLLAGLALFLASGMLSRYERLKTFAHTIERYGLVTWLMSFYALSVWPENSRIFLSMNQAELGVGENASWIAATIVGVALVGGLVEWHRRHAPMPLARAVARAGAGLFTALAVVMLAIVFDLMPPALIEKTSVMHVALILLYFAALVWLIYVGYHGNDSFWINTAFVFFALGTLTLYFETFWSLMGRSFFFMGGGVLLLAGGGLLEFERRRLIARMRRGNEAAS